jgi:phage baseplate assembly protein W
VALYKGFSTKFYGKCNAYSTNSGFSLADVKLIKQDLLNHIFTGKGERVMQPSFGTIIPEMLFEPFDSNSISIIEEEITRVISSDPRVELLNLELLPNYDSNNINVNVLLQYIELNMVDNFNLNIQFE